MLLYEINLEYHQIISLIDGVLGWFYVIVYRENEPY
jgi:hypothetical protein